MQRAWGGEPVPGTHTPVTPEPTHAQRVPITVGSTSDATLRRVGE